MITIKNLYIYPVKSLGAISLEHMEFDDLGPKLDRRFMLVDENQQMLTQRKHPQLAKFQCEIANNQLIISFEDKKINIDLNEHQQNTIHSQVWSDDVSGLEVNSEFSKWFSNILGFEAKLIKFNPNSQRIMDKNYDHTSGKVGFADGFQILLTQQSSLEALELEQNEDMLRFRPNIVLQGDLAFTEDYWRKISINDIEFSIVKPCSRCSMPAVNPKDASKQPEVIKALAQKRLFNNETFFGQNMVVSKFSSNKITLTDRVSIIEKSNFSNIV